MVLDRHRSRKFCNLVHDKCKPSTYIIIDGLRRAQAGESFSVGTSFDAPVSITDQPELSETAPDAEP
jgi:hypothetical protein